MTDYQAKQFIKHMRLSQQSVEARRAAEQAEIERQYRVKLGYAWLALGALAATTAGWLWGCR